jgi:predicted porin
MQHKKALIAAAITAGLTVSANAAAEATIYGKIHTSIASISQDDGTNDTSATAISSHSSRLGIKAKKGLENGMEVSAKAEFEMDAVSGGFSKSKDYELDYDGDGITDETVTDNDNDTFKARNVYVGLKGGFGEVRVGRHDTPHKLSTKKLEVFGDTYADYNNIITIDNRLGNIVAYLNNFGPVGFAAAYYAGDDDVEAENAGDATSVMINYSGGPLYLSAAVESYAADDDTDANELETATKFGVGYTIGPVDLGLVYQTLAYELADDETETYVSAKFKIDDSMKLKAAYGMRDDDVDATDDEVMTAVGLDYKLDKSATVYALYANGTDGGLAKKAKLKGDGSALALGVVYKF